MNAKEIFIWAAKDVGLYSVPQRNADGSFEFCTGLLTILNKLIYQPLRTLNIRLRNIEKEKAKLQSTIIPALGNAVESEKERFQQEDCVLQENLSKIENTIDSTSKKHQKFEDGLVVRNFNTFPEENSSISSIPATKTKTSWHSLVFSFVFCELLTTGLLWLSMRDFLSLTEVLIRSTGILAIFLGIHFAGNLKRTHGITYTYFQVFGLIMLLSAMFTGPVLSVLFPLDIFTNSSTWDLNSVINETETVTATPTLVQFYRNFPSIEAVLVLISFFSFQTFVSPKSVSTIEIPKESPKMQTPDEEIKQIRQLHQKEKEKLENEKQTLKNQRENGSKQHNVNLSNLLDEVKKTNQRIQELEDEAQTAQIQYDTLFNELRSELHCFEVEYKSNISDLNNAQFSSLSWPSKADILTYYKIKP